MKKRSGVIYLLQLHKDANIYKIGHAKDLMKRIQDISNYLPYEPVLIKAFFVSDRFIGEKSLHNYLAVKHLKNEWFELSDEDIDWLSFKNRQGWIEGQIQKWEESKLNRKSWSHEIYETPYNEYLPISKRLLQAGFGDLSIVEKRLLIQLMACVPNDYDGEILTVYAPDLPYTFNKGSNSSLHHIKDAITVLRELSRKDGDFWFKNIEYDSASITFSFNTESRAKLEKDEVVYVSVQEWLSLKSKHSMRMYELLLSSEGAKISWSLEEIVELMNLDDSYQTFSSLKQRVISGSEKEINERTSLKFFFVPIRTGRKVTRINFNIKAKDKTATR